MSTFKKAILQLHVFVFLAGLTGPLGYLIQLNGILLVFYRMLINSVVLWGIYMFRKNHSYPIKTKLQLLGVGAIIAMHWVCFYASIKLANISIALVCFSSTSLFSSILEPLAKKYKIQVQEIWIGLLSLVGILFQVYMNRPIIIMSANKTMHVGRTTNILLTILSARSNFPENILKQKEIFFFEKFLKKWDLNKSMEKFVQFLNFVSYKYNMSFDDLSNDFKDFINEEKTNLAQTSMAD